MFKIINIFFLIIICLFLSGCIINKDMCFAVKQQGKLLKAIRKDYESLVIINEINIKRLENINDLKTNNVDDFRNLWFMTQNWSMLLESQRKLEEVCDNKLK